MSNTKQKSKSKGLSKEVMKNLPEGLKDELEIEAKKMKAKKGIIYRMYSSKYRNAKSIYVSSEMLSGTILEIPEYDEVVDLGEPFMVADGIPRWIVRADHPTSVKLDLIDTTENGVKDTFKEKKFSSSYLKQKADYLKEKFMYMVDFEKPKSYYIIILLVSIVSFLMGYVIFFPM